MATESVEILFQDEHLLAINKPAGLRTLPDGYQPDLEHVRSLLEPRFGRLWIVHRLDKETSGVLLLARSAEAHHLLNDQFAGRVIKKEYHALVRGAPNLDDWEIRLPLRIDGDRNHRTAIDLQRGKPAVTQISVLERYPGHHSLVSARPLTGYTHQIRTHLAACNLPILGDPLYAARPHPAAPDDLRITPPDCSLSAGRLGLHAFSIQFSHPFSQQALTLTAPYPADFQALRLALGSNNA